MHNNKLDYPDLVNSLEKRGVAFNDITKFDAIKILETKNYYYKITAYRKNFSKSNRRKYKELDFSYLVDLASIDMQVRYWLLNLCLDIEHSLKTQVLYLITKNKEEDGFELVTEFSNVNPRGYTKTINQLKYSRYHDDMYKKRRDKLPVWTLIETMDFGTLCSFVRFYYKKYENIELKKMHDLCMNAKNIRNTCAHSNVLLINFFGEWNSLEKTSLVVLNISRKMKISTRHSRSKKVNDLISLIYLEKVYGSEAVIKIRKESGLKLLERAKRNGEKYKNNSNLTEMYEIFTKLVEFL
ncbi:Abi family protein [Lactococcus petauri]|uniref:Abi family protein n=1 Tax=Lactococcus petauri TaxID=1940789 RepID=UPI002434B05C|nr:Abi family protein [Lactococcus petauri]MDG6137577.1 Abi family protein [Lactococcus petauri]